MLKKITVLVGAAAALIGVSLFVSACSSLPGDAAASVNGVVISKDDVNHRIDLTRVLFPSEVPEDTESQEFIDYRSLVTKQMVSEEMEKQEADKRGLSVSDQEVEDALAVYVEDKYLGDVEKMQQAFAEQGVSVDDLRAEIRRDILHQKLLDSVHSETVVTEQEVADFYELNKSRYVYPEKRQVRQIVLSDQATAQAAAARIASGEDFATVAAAVSTDSSTASKGGLIGLMSKDQLPAAIADAAFSLSQSEVSQPFQADSKWYIVKVDIVSPASNKTLDELKDDLMLFLTNQRFAQRWRDYSAQLWDTYDIEYADGYEPSEEALEGTGAETQPGQ